MEVMHYIAADGSDPFQDWMDALRDVKARVAILRRIDRLMIENYGDHKFSRDGVWELRIDTGLGYRVYYARAARAVIVLLCAGSKRTQTRDIDRAVENWVDFKRRQT